MESETVKELQKIAKARGLKGYTKMRKADLLELLMKNRVLSNHDDIMNFNDGVVNKIESKSVKELKKIAKERGLCRYSKLKKADLLSMIADSKPSGAGFDSGADEQSAKPIRHVKSKTWCDWLVDIVPIPAGFSGLMNS
jgi:transcription termination factor Rho